MKLGKNIVLGVDVNLAASEFPPELRKLATSLKAETGRHLARAELAAVLLRELDRDYERIRNHQFQKIADEWEAQCVTLGRRVSIQIGGRSVRGLAESLDDDGALLLRTEHGRIERIIGGDVMLDR